MILDPWTDLKDIGKKHKPKQSLVSKVLEGVLLSSFMVALYGGTIYYVAKMDDKAHTDVLERLHNAKKIEYFVQEGDTFSDMAGTEGLAFDGRSFDFVEYVARLNKINPNSNLKPGQRIVIPDLNGDGYVGTKYNHNLKKSAK